jgi:hypothetical protein
MSCPLLLHNNRLQRTALRAATEPQRRTVSLTAHQAKMERLTK